MPSLVKTLFGGTDTSAQDLQSESNRRAIELFEELAGQSRRDALGLFPQGQQLRARGFGEAARILGQSFPRQEDLITRGAEGAQSAILGTGVPDISGFRTATPTFNFGDIAQFLTAQTGGGPPGAVNAPVANDPLARGAPGVAPGNADPGPMAFPALLALPAAQRELLNQQIASKRRERTAGGFFTGQVG